MHTSLLVGVALACCACGDQFLAGEGAVDAAQGDAQGDAAPLVDSAAPEGADGGDALDASVLDERGSTRDSGAGEASQIDATGDDSGDSGGIDSSTNVDSGDVPCSPQIPHNSSLACPDGMADVGGGWQWCNTKGDVAEATPVECSCLQTYNCACLLAHYVCPSGQPPTSCQEVSPGYALAAACN